ncbi:MAG TPA: division/cell wall cluster transcriptional repressor MraZ [Gammaproteobacteria bacterium]|nr:division/cell wall cluster transcriptional repressor MraZ [Gammaproteobacteria bacterium]
MFYGGNPVNLDAKGRMALPTRFRESLMSSCDGRLAVTMHHVDRCLSLYPYPEWEEVQRKLTRLPNQDSRTRWLQRRMLGQAVEVEMDGHGRIIVPATLREYADLDKRVILAGMGNKFEIWNEEAWARMRDAYEGEELAGSGPEVLSTLSL